MQRHGVGVQRDDLVRSVRPGHRVDHLVQADPARDPRRGPRGERSGTGSSHGSTVGAPAAGSAPRRLASAAVPDDRYVDVLAQPRRRRTVPEIAAEPGLVVETADGRFRGAVVSTGRDVVDGERRDTVTLEDRHGRRRTFQLLPAAFLLDGAPVTLTPAQPVATPKPRARTASGSYAAPKAPARVARASRIWVEGVHDAALIERIWGDDLRVEGVVVEPIDGVDELPSRIAQFAPGPTRRVGVLVDHLVPGSKESRIAAAVRS